MMKKIFYYVIKSIKLKIKNFRFKLNFNMKKNYFITGGIGSFAKKFISLLIKKNYK